jgi:hypothetical protein
MTESKPEEKGIVKKTVDGTKNVAEKQWDLVKEHPGGAVTGAVLGTMVMPIVGTYFGGLLGAYISKKNS